MSSYAPKEAVLGSPVFFLVNPDDLEGLNEWAEYLDSILHGPCRIEKIGHELCLVEERQLVEKVRGLRVEIYGREHPPPHFHVKSGNVDASFSIDDCRCIKGGDSVSRKVLHSIQYWHKDARLRLVEIWNATRPDGCSVGVFRGQA